jgi:hypothetical protein
MRELTRKQQHWMIRINRVGQVFESRAQRLLRSGRIAFLRQHPPEDEPR